jgi:electron transfer flavoprotein alpha subunit
MSTININQNKVTEPEKLVTLCPFGAIENSNGKISINAACKMCKICLKKKPEIFELIEIKLPEADKSAWTGIAVYADHVEGAIHPVTFELIGKARELASKVKQPVYCLMAGNNISKKAAEILEYGADEIFVYEQPELEHFRIEPYTAVFEDFINNVKPCVVLVGGTTAGRSLAPRIAARFRTGLTADCTVLGIQENTNLDQIRPAFGGNIMAHINTPRHRPQFATVRYKIFSAPEKTPNPAGRLTKCSVPPDKLKSAIRVLEIKKKPPETSIEEADIIVVAGRGIKKEDDMRMIHNLANSLGGQVAATRSLIEAGWVDPRRQIGLSGRTVKPSLIITCGVSGAIQFVAGMKNSSFIVAVNTDSDAPIFKHAHLVIHGDIYEILPTLNKKLKSLSVEKK